MTLRAHADYSAFTLVLQDEVSGLEVLNANGHWVRAPVIPHAFVVNCGNYLQIATNGVFKSTVHRVISMPGEDRYSLPTFVSPTPNTIIAPLPSLIGPGEEAKFEPVNIEQSYVSAILLDRGGPNHPSSKLIKERGIKTEDLNFAMLQGVFPEV